MGPEAWIVVAVVVLIVTLLAVTSIAADIVMIGGVVLLMTIDAVSQLTPHPFKILSPDQAVAGMSNEGMITVAVLFVVAAGIRETGGLSLVAQRVLGRPTSLLAAQLRMMLPTAAMSSFMNNTPLVAMMVPVVDDWCKKNRLAPSKLMMPLSFATILGGLCTLLGTSTNVIIAGLMASQRDHRLNLFDVAWVGLPCAIVGIAYMALTSRWLLPERKSAISSSDDPRQYTVEMMVEPNSSLVGQTIEQAGLRHLPGMYLAEIERDGQVLAAVGPTERLRGNDRLLFVGVVESVKDLQKFRGLVPATDQVFKLNAPRTHRLLVEAVVSNTHPLTGRSIREGRFRSRYNAAVIAVARNGERVKMKIGDIVLEPGDTLLLETHPEFAERHKDSRDFYLVSAVADSTPPRHDKAWVAVAVLAGMVLVAALEWLTMLNAALIAAGLMVASRCCSADKARRSVDWQVLLVIAASFGLGKAMQVSGAAQAIASTLVGVAGTHPWLVLAVIYLVTMIFTEVLSNNAAAVLMFPLAIATAEKLGVSEMPFVIVLMMAASCGFATPIGYQTNLMVYGPGGYRFTDYLRFGGILNLIVMAVTLAIAPLAFPFHPAP